jgi:hypothetical protein
MRKPVVLSLVQYILLLLNLLQQLMLQLLSLFGSYFSKRILLFSVYIGCFTATAKIIREIVNILIHYNSIHNNGGQNSLFTFYPRISLNAECKHSREKIELEKTGIS